MHTRHIRFLAFEPATIYLPISVRPLACILVEVIIWSVSYSDCLLLGALLVYLKVTKYCSAIFANRDFISAKINEIDGELESSLHSVTQMKF